MHTGGRKILYRESYWLVSFINRQGRWLLWVLSEPFGNFACFLINEDLPDGGNGGIGIFVITSRLTGGIEGDFCGRPLYIVEVV